MATIHLIIQGKVQGVFYRVSARKKALELGVKGWVKNTPDRHVEIMATANEEALANFVAWCKQGPSNAHVENVIAEAAVEQDFDDFKIVH